MRHKRALKDMRTNLLAATERLHCFLSETAPENVIKRVHTAQTEVDDENDNQQVVTYYSLWTDFADLRLTKEGELLRGNDENKYRNIREKGTDKSILVTADDLETYKTAHLQSLAAQLGKFLISHEEPTDKQVVE